jgi:sporulation integral membrane protein YlbJ
VNDRSKDNLKTLIIALIAVAITVLIVVFSESAFNAALEGLNVWWKIVFPSLLPFFIIAEILMGLGVVHFLGALLEPLMRPLFKVPGVGAFAMSMGLASGYPIGAKITANLRRKKLCTKTEGERLLAFTNTADPLFMIGAVAVGMFHRADLALIIAGAHYISSILIGLIMRFYRGDKESENKIQQKNNVNKNILVRAYDELITARKNDGRTIGELLGDSIKESINTLFMVGGFIILFSVVTEIFIVTGIIDIFSKVIMIVLGQFGFSQATVIPIISGFFEITNGANLASQAQAPLLEKLVIVNAVIAWSGLSVLAQVATMINGTDIKLKPYIFARILQSILAGIVTFFLFIPYGKNIQPTFLSETSHLMTVENNIIIISLIILAILGISLLFSLIFYFFKKINVVIFHSRY